MPEQYDDNGKIVATDHGVPWPLQDRFNDSDAYGRHSRGFTFHTEAAENIVRNESKFPEPDQTMIALAQVYATLAQVHATALLTHTIRRAGLNRNGD